MEGYRMLEIFCEILISVFAVYGAYTILKDVKRFLFGILERRNKRNANTPRTK